MAKLIGNDSLLIRSVGLTEIQIVNEDVMRVVFFDEINNFSLNSFKEIYHGRMVKRIIPVYEMNAIVRDGKEIVKIPITMTAITKEGDVRPIILQDGELLCADLIPTYEGLECDSKHIPYGVEVREA